WFEFTGTSRVKPEDWSTLVHPEDRDRVTAQWAQCMHRLATYNGRFRLRHYGGGYRWVSAIGEAQRDDSGNVLGWIGTCTDIDERIKTRHALKTIQTLSKGVLEASQDCIGVLDTSGTVLVMNEAFRNHTGMNDSAVAVGDVWGKVYPLDTRIATELAIKTAAFGSINSLIFRLDSADGSVHWWDAVVTPIRDDAGDVTELAVIARNITDQKESEADLRWTATHDTLTNLASRLLFQETIAGAIADGKPFCLLILDIDNFKHTNDEFGHDTGDALLVQLGERLTDSIGKNDFVARIGGDEFVVIFRDLTCRKDTHARAQRIADNLKAPWLHNGHILDCEASIGLSSFPKHGETKAALMKGADIAMYVSKDSNRGEVTFFGSPMLLAIEHRETMLTLARAALDDDLIFPCYQPIVDLRTGRLVGFEALLRWRYKARRVQQPGTIEAAFQDADLATRISDRMIRCVLGDIGRWLDKKIEFGYVTINTVSSDFRQDNFAEQLLSKLAFANIPASCIQIEVTETVFLGRGAECVERALKLLSEHGVKVALDDFGTGYAALSHLRQCPVGAIKIDRSFVKGLPEDNESVSIVEAVICLGRSLNIRVVAEGIETLAQESLLTRLGCPFGQGYLYAKAMPASLVSSFVGSFSRGTPSRITDSRYGEKSSILIQSPG
uniref:putative bifunctional diguanylate cyclase/phosphodiesterase n=1 Tax=Blastomonas sp. TaxID=1909299 RepID=UPI0035937DAA